MDYRATYDRYEREQAAESERDLKRANLVFVYGSLMTGGHCHYLLEAAESIGGTWRTEAAEFKMMDLGMFPACGRGGDNRIVGQVYEVGPALLERLDLLEGHPRLYCRDVVRVTFGDLERDAWMYLMNVERGGRPVPGGDYRSARPDNFLDHA
jgi:gamma-glutamylaminecyclotransferase